VLTALSSTLLDSVRERSLTLVQVATPSLLALGGRCVFETSQ
jgi:hypothetical protein